MLHPGLSAVSDRQTLNTLLKIQSDHEWWFTTLLQGLYYFASVESCSCVTSLLISSFPSLSLITLVVFEAAFGANSHTCCQREARIPASEVVHLPWEASKQQLSHKPSNHLQAIHSLKTLPFFSFLRKGDEG